MRGTQPPPCFCSYLFFTYRSMSGCSNRYLSNCKASRKATWGLCLSEEWPFRLSSPASAGGPASPSQLLTKHLGPG